MKKIIFVIDSLNCGGAEKSLVTLLSVFDYKKYDVDLLIFKRNGAFEKFLPNKVNIIEPPCYMQLLNKPLKKNLSVKNLRYIMSRIDTSFMLRINNKLVGKLHSAQVIWKSINSCIESLNKKYDVAIAYSQGLPTYYVATKVSADKKLAWINTDYNTAGYKKDYDYDFYKVFNYIVAVSDKLRSILVAVFPYFKDKIITIYDVIDPNFLYTIANSEAGFTDKFNGLKIVTIGRMVPYKGYDIAVEACEKLKKDGCNFKWYVIGDGSSRKSIEKLIKQKNLEDVFILLGEKSNPYQFLNQADIYVQTSKFEGFGLSIAEAKIFRKPIVSTNFPVIYDQIQNGYNGIIVGISAEAVYNGVRLLIENIEIRKKLIKNLSTCQPYSTVGEINKIYDIISG